MSHIKETLDKLEFEEIENQAIDTSKLEFFKTVKAIGGLFIVGENQEEMVADITHIKGRTVQVKVGNEVKNIGADLLEQTAIVTGVKILKKKNFNLSAVMVKKLSSARSRQVNKQAKLNEKYSKLIN